MEFVLPKQADDICREVAQDKKRMRNYKVKDSVLIKYKGSGERLVVPYGIEELTSTGFGKLPRAACDIDKKRARLSSVREVVLPGTLRRIAEDAFGGMPNLERVTVSDRNDRFISDNGVLMYADRSCLFCYPRASDIGEYVLPDAVTHIPERAFYRCKKLRRIQMGRDLREIKRAAFQECSSLREVTLNQSLRTIGPYAFANCSALESVSLPQQLTEIGENAFENSAVQEIDIPSSVKQIKESAFESCGELKKATFHEGLRAIGMFAFACCEELQEAILPEGLIRIEAAAFSDCPSLKRVFIPASVTEMESEVFTADSFNENKESCVITVARKTIPDGWSDLWCADDNARLVWKE